MCSEVGPPSCWLAQHVVPSGAWSLAYEPSSPPEEEMLGVVSLGSPERRPAWGEVQPLHSLPLQTGRQWSPEQQAGSSVRPGSCTRVLGAAWLLHAGPGSRDGQGAVSTRADARAFLRCPAVPSKGCPVFEGEVSGPKDASFLSGCYVTVPDRWPPALGRWARSGRAGLPQAPELVQENTGLLSVAEHSALCQHRCRSPRPWAQMRRGGKHNCALTGHTGGRPLRSTGCQGVLARPRANVPSCCLHATAVGL